MTNKAVPFFKNGLKPDLPLSLAGFMALAALIVQHPLSAIFVVGAIVCVTFFLTREAERMFEGRSRTYAQIYMLVCVTVLFLINIPAAVILLMPACGYFAKRQRDAAQLSDDFMTALRDRSYKLLILSMLIVFVAILAYGFRVVPDAMNDKPMELSSFSRIKVTADDGEIE